MTYEKTTDHIRIRVEPSFLEDQSSPEDNRYVWAYRVRIHNNGKRAVRLMSRYWRITDANGMVQEVEGEGVVGEQPLLRPGEIFEYTSGAPLPTPSGFMSGSYTMHNELGDPFKVEIPPFSLDSPHQSQILQ